MEPELVVTKTREREPELELECVRCLAQAEQSRGVLHEPGQRERYRGLLERAITHAEDTLAAMEVERERNVVLLGRARATLARAHAAKAEDARHGAGQLSLSAQRAPTRAACDDGWRRVEAIVVGAEASARVAARMARAFDAPSSAVARSVERAAQRASAAARAARKLVDERNHAYTFHADSRFSFGEGWYVAAAAVLTEASIQIEPEKDGTAQATYFLNAAGLGARLEPYRSRPRAMKQTTELVARAFRADPVSSQRRLRAAFLGTLPVPSAVSAWIEHRFRDVPRCAAEKRKVLLWIRDGAHHPNRNTRAPELGDLTARVCRAGLVPVMIGDALRGERVPDGALDMILFWKDPLFRGVDMRRAQLQFFEELRRRHGLVGQLGVTTAGMDGPALLGLPTLYLTDAPNVRMREWVGAVPGYTEVVRDHDYLERVSAVLSAWASSEPSERLGC